MQFLYRVTDTNALITSTSLNSDPAQAGDCLGTGIMGNAVITTSPQSSLGKFQQSNLIKFTTKNWGKFF